MSQNPASPPPTFAGLDALGPCMVEFGVTGISTGLKPITAASATAKFAGFLGSTAVRAYGAGRC